MRIRYDAEFEVSNPHLDKDYVKDVIDDRLRDLVNLDRFSSQALEIKSAVGYTVVKKQQK